LVAALGRCCPFYNSFLLVKHSSLTTSSRNSTFALNK
jgi:hypothetical protein